MYDRTDVHLTLYKALHVCELCVFYVSDDLSFDTPSGPHPSQEIMKVDGSTSEMEKIHLG